MYLLFELLSSFIPLWKTCLGWSILWPSLTLWDPHINSFLYSIYYSNYCLQQLFYIFSATFFYKVCPFNLWTIMAFHNFLYFLSNSISVNTNFRTIYFVGFIICSLWNYPTLCVNGLPLIPLGGVVISEGELKTLFLFAFSPIGWA